MTHHPKTRKLSMKLTEVTKSTYFDYLDNNLLADTNIRRHDFAMKTHINQKGHLMAQATYKVGCEPVFHIMAADEHND